MEVGTQTVDAEYIHRSPQAQATLLKQDGKDSVADGTHVTPSQQPSPDVDTMAYLKRMVENLLNAKCEAVADKCASDSPRASPSARDTAIFHAMSCTKFSASGSYDRRKTLDITRTCSLHSSYVLQLTFLILIVLTYVINPVASRLCGTIVIISIYLFPIQCLSPSPLGLLGLPRFPSPSLLPPARSHTAWGTRSGRLKTHELGPPRRRSQPLPRPCSAADTAVSLSCHEPPSR